MNNTLVLPPVSYLREMLSYDPCTGALRWEKAAARNTRIGSVAGYVNQGYWRIKLNKVDYLAHRICFCIFHGELDAATYIDHINGDRSDNRASNLRACTMSQNSANIGVNPKNKTGLKGVFRHRKAYRASITVRGSVIYLGTYATADVAKAAYDAAAISHFGEFARLS